MADRIAILVGEPIKSGSQAQSPFKPYRPQGTAKRVAIGNYVRLQNGETRYVDTAADSKSEWYAQWCAQCGTPIDPDGNDHYSCDDHYCDAVLCENCGGSDHHCPRHREMLATAKKCEYTYPYASEYGGQFTFGVEIELESELDADFVENVTNSNLIAGWDKDPSLGQNGVELQTNILNMSKLPALRQLVEGIPHYGDNAGGHIHVARTANQCASRWYWALHGLDPSQCERLNMRHLADNYWCQLSHGEYTGKHTAVNDEHADTIELRTFDCWYEDSVEKLVPAIRWVRAMWRFFEKHPRGTVKAKTIEQYAYCMADNVADTPSRTLAERLNAARRVKAANVSTTPPPASRYGRGANIGRHRVIENISRSRLARQTDD